MSKRHFMKYKNDILHHNLAYSKRYVWGESATVLLAYKM